MPSRRESGVPPPSPDCPSPRVSSRSEEHTSELQSLTNLVCRLLLEKKKAPTPEASQESKMGDPSGTMSTSSSTPGMDNLMQACEAAVTDEKTASRPRHPA